MTLKLLTCAAETPLRRFLLTVEDSDTDVKQRLSKVPLTIIINDI